jgi:MFS family permease
VVLFQFWVTRRVSKYRPLIIMAAGTVLYALGFAMYGLVSYYGSFLAAMAIITVGEMMVSPVGQAIVARLAPEAMRGRYMAVYGFSWVLPSAFGPLLAGLVMDNLDPHWVWYGAGILGLAAAGAFYLLEVRVGRARWAAVDRRLRIIQQVEEGAITAEEGARQLDGVGPGIWSRLSPHSAHETPNPRKLRIRLSDLDSGAMKVDLRLPLGLVNTVLYLGGQLSPDLEDSHVVRLRELVAAADAAAGPRRLDTSDERLEVDLE